VSRWGFVIVLITVALVLAGFTSLGVVTVRNSFPDTDGAIQVAPLSRPVVVLRDSYGIPRIYADNPEDLFAAQGFVHAQDRFFEMDVRRHRASGRLSELFGASQREADTFVRTLGWRRVAEQELTLISQRSRRYLESYAAGVNAYLERQTTNEISLEYAVLGLQGLSYVPEPWTAVDTLALLKGRAWDASGNIAQELEIGVLSATLGEDRARSIQPYYDSEVFHPVVTHGGVRGEAFDPTAGPGRAPVTPSRTIEAAAVPALRRTALARIRAAPWLGSAGEIEGSNAWVVSGDRTATGRPILANDPHAHTSIPARYAQVGLHCRTVNEECPFDVTGFSYSGVPGVVIGHNAHIAWGVSDSQVDTQDLVLEQIRDGRVRRGPDWEQVTFRTELIDVADGEPQEITVRETSHGPVLSDVDVGSGRLGRLPGPDGVETAVALRWSGLQPSRSVEAIFELNRATNFGEFRQAAGLLTVPSQSLVYADVTGTIGYQLTGAIPIRQRGDGSLPVPGWDPAYGWERMIPVAELPYAENPPEGLVVAANQTVVAGYPHPLGSNFSIGWRSQQIIRELNARAVPLTVEDVEAVFADSDVRYADLILPALLAVEPAEDWVRDGQRVLAEWDHASPPDSAGAFFFHLVMKHVIHLTFDDEIPAELRTSTGDRGYAVVAQLLREPSNEWWDDKDTTVVEDRDTILGRALSRARTDATTMGSRDPAGWSWGHVHRLRLQHQTLGSTGPEPVQALFNRGDHRVGGSSAVVLAWSFDDRERGFNVTAGPVMKMVVDLDDLDNSRWINLSGQSGHAFHPNYNDQLALMARNELLAWPFTRHRVQAVSTQRLELLPGR
jgi:penicillin amidase